MRQAPPEFLHPIRAHRARRGGALLFALIVVAAVAGISVSLLRITSFVTGRQAASVDEKRAFYLAEAGLSEAYFGLKRGYNGVIGTSDAPVRVGDGLVWVEANENAEGLVALRSTALCDTGRSTLELVVEPFEQDLGVFSDEGIDLNTPFLVDGFDSEESPYHEQLGPGTITLDLTNPYIWLDTQNHILFYDGIFYRYQAVDGLTFAYDAVLDYTTLDDPEIQYDDFIDSWDSAATAETVAMLEGTLYTQKVAMDSDLAASGYTTDSTWTTLTSSESFGDFGDTEYKLVLQYFYSIPETSFASSGDATLADPTGPLVGGSLGPSTGDGGALSSNGNIFLSSPDQPVQIYGDVFHGLDGQIDLGSGVSVSGDTGELGGEVVLEPVEPPSVEWLPGFLHESAIPKVIPPGDIGYEYVVLASGSEMVVMGEGQVVVGNLELQDGSRMKVENLDGPVDLYVTGRTDLALGSEVFVASTSPSNLSLQIVGDGNPVNLYARSQFYGSVYAPFSDVFVGNDFELFGFLAVKHLDVEPGTRFHFDSGLAGGGHIPPPRLVGWRIEEVPANVRASRMDPFQLFGYTDEEEAPPIDGAQETDGWMVEITHWTGSDVTDTYLGPLHTYVPPSGFDYYGADKKTLEPPAENAADWMIRCDYQDKMGKNISYEGPVATWGGFWAVSFQDFRVWLPQDQQ